MPRGQPWSDPNSDPYGDIQQVIRDHGIDPNDTIWKDRPPVTDEINGVEPTVFIEDEIQTFDKLEPRPGDLTLFDGEPGHVAIMGSDGHLRMAGTDPAFLASMYPDLNPDREVVLEDETYRFVHRTELPRHPFIEAKPYVWLFNKKTRKHELHPVPADAWRDINDVQPA
jgi:hypothetical protein